jgi:hypothetical protein
MVQVPGFFKMFLSLLRKNVLSAYKGQVGECGVVGMVWYVCVCVCVDSTSTTTAAG